MAREFKELLAAALLACGTGLAAEPADFTLSEAEQQRPQLPPVLPVRDQAQIVDNILRERLDTLVPQLMRESRIDFWVVSAREYFEDPITASLLDAESMHARRRTILAFYDPGEGMPVERLTISRYGMGGLFDPAWDPEEQPDQWRALADAIEARDPAAIGINTSSASALADGMTLSEYRSFEAALPAHLRARVVPAEQLAVRWLEQRTQGEMALYPMVLRTAHAIIGEAFSGKVIQPGKTTADDVVWWYRQRLANLGLTPWFQPSIGIQRRGTKGMLEGAAIIQPGDLLWTDFGITYVRLNTDTQHLAYVLRPGEGEAPDGLHAGLKAMNRVQDILRGEFREGRSGNETLAAARSKAIAEGFDPSIYSHPIGLHGHGAGPAIGFWDNQAADPRGSGALRAGTAWSIELTNRMAVPEWDGQIVDFRGEENAWFDGSSVRFIDGRQTELTLIP